MSLTNTLEQQIGAHLLRTGSWTKPANIYVALLKSNPGEAGALDEVSGGAYARVAAGPLDNQWAPPSGGNKQFSNAVDFTFPAPNADWGYVTHFAIMDAGSGGLMLAYAPLTVPRNVYGNDPAPTFSAGDFKLSFTGHASDYLVEQIGNHLLRSGTWIKPSGIYVGLQTDASAEVSGGGYARVVAGPGDGIWSGPAGGDGNHANVSAIAWSSPSSDWGNVASVILANAGTAGNTLAAIPLATPRNILNGAIAPNFAPGDLSLAFD